MNNSRITFPTLLITAHWLFLAYACEKPLDGEYVSELQPPTDSLEIELNLFSTDDTLYLFGTTQFHYNFSNLEYPFVQGRFTMGTKVWELHEPWGPISISPDDFDAGYHSLHMEVFLKTSSGSLADQVGAEIYKLERRWTILCDNRPTPTLSLSYYPNENGFLTLTWTPHENFNFKSYQISRTGYNIPSFQELITEQDILTFVDHCYIAGHAKYTIRAQSYGEAGWGDSDENSSVVLNLEKPAIHFEAINKDYLRIYWQRLHYGGRHDLSSGNNFILQASTDTSVVVPMPGFGSQQGYLLESYPVYGNHCFYSGFIRDGSMYYLGDPFNATFSTRYAYNSLENVLYTHKGSNFMAYDMDNMELISSYTLNDLSSHSPIATSQETTAVVISGRENLYIFPDSNLTNPLVISFETPFLPYRFLSLVPNKYISNAFSHHIHLFDINNGQQLASLAYPTIPISAIDLSIDASYAAFTGQQSGLWIYSHNNYEFEQIYNSSLPYESIAFHPTEPDKIFIIATNSNILELRTLPAYSLEQSWQLPEAGMTIGNFDPITGYMLLHHHHMTGKQLILMDFQTGQPVFSIRNDDLGPRFFKNRLFSQNGYTLDITEYLPDMPTKHYKKNVKKNSQ